MRVSDDLRKAVIYFGVNGPNGFSAIGTAFVLDVTHRGIDFGYVVTARHNLEMVSELAEPSVRMNMSNGGARTVELPRAQWVTRDIPGQYNDVAVFPISLAPSVTGEFDFSRIDETLVLSDALANELQINPGESVVTVGLFAQHQGAFRNIPIVRVGNIAALEAEVGLVNTDRGLMPAHLIEMRSIGGLSGSPVFVQLAPYRMIGAKVVSSAGRNPNYLLGMVRGNFATQNPLDVVQPPRVESVEGTSDDELPVRGFDETMNTGIAVVVPIRQVVEMLNSPELIALRDARADEQEAKISNCDTNAPGRE